jgi:lysozyme family protein
MSSNFDIAIETVLANEGGLVEDKMDPGGLTNFGLSQRSYPKLDIRNLTREEAIEIYRRDWWHYAGIIDQRVATKILDSCVNMGEHAAIFLLQEIVLQVIKPDGIYGEVTEDAVNRLDPNALLTAYRAKLEQHYRNIVLARPEEMKFLDGWLRRAKQ